MNGIILNICTVFIITEIIAHQQISDYWKMYLAKMVNSSVWSFFSYLFDCFFCTSFWISLSICTYFDKLSDVRLIFLYMVIANILNRYEIVVKKEQ